MTQKLKEVKFRPRTEAHDLAYKTRHIREFLDKGHRVRLVVQFKGREMAHPEYGEKMLDQVISSVTGDFMVGPYRNEGRLISCELKPS
jgi:translation initiation factor IF-3